MGASERLVVSPRPALRVVLGSFGNKLIICSAKFFVRTARFTFFLLHSSFLIFFSAFFLLPSYLLISSFPARCEIDKAWKVSDGNRESHISNYSPWRTGYILAIISPGCGIATSSRPKASISFTSTRPSTTTLSPARPLANESAPAPPGTGSAV